MFVNSEQRNNFPLMKVIIIDKAFFAVGTTSKGKKFHYAHWLGISLKVPKSRGGWSGEVALLKYHIRLRGACNN